MLRTMLTVGALASAAIASAQIVDPETGTVLVRNGDFESGFTDYSSEYQRVDPALAESMVPEGVYSLIRGVAGQAPLVHAAWEGFVDQTSLTPDIPSGTYFAANGSVTPGQMVWISNTFKITTSKIYRFSAKVANLCCNAESAQGPASPLVFAIYDVFASRALYTAETPEYLEYFEGYVASFCGSGTYATGFKCISENGQVELILRNRVVLSPNYVYNRDDPELGGEMGDPVITTQAPGAWNLVKTEYRSHPLFCEGGCYDGPKDVVLSLVNLDENTIYGNDFAIDDIGFYRVGVPEPATWGLMIAGFGLVGATLRRSRIAHAA